MFERVQIMKKSHVCTVQCVLSNPYILLLTSHDLPRKVQTMVLNLKLTQEPKIAMRPREVRLQKGPCGLGLKIFFFFLKTLFYMETPFYKKLHFYLCMKIFFPYFHKKT